MTTLELMNNTCKACKTRSSFHVLTSTNSMGVPDLDFRPPPMARDTLQYEIQTCPHCGYCAPDISSGNKKRIALITTQEYQDILHHAAFPDLANRYLAMGYLAEKVRDSMAAFFSYRSAAWVCDDLNHANGMIYCRKTALNALNLIHDSGKNLCHDPGCDELLCADLLRRCALFVEAAGAVQTGLSRQVDEAIRLALLFEGELITRWDTFCYRFDQIPGFFEAIETAQDRNE